MFAYIVRRSFAGFIMLIVMSFVTYMLFFAAPIHPERYACGKNCSVAQQRADQARRWATTSPLSCSGPTSSRAS